MVFKLLMRLVRGGLGLVGSFSWVGNRVKNWVGCFSLDEWVVGR